MIKYYCDRCGKEIEPYSIFNIVITPNEEMLQMDMYTDIQKFVVCPKCASEIANAFEGVKE